ncbi:hypothetical protein GALMADRAFT_78443 [Galerina marginata CBS 339.88]|uniref:NAD-dependent epimerase/dehydratase domain-containing protein n=1 Tax=Galerina marginata (strain CBS 339.88) TaxID=685588 RepID=A0A067SP60_GALM3|nr:hypothetical protein GALMADRAFT_78443 [Galerina marginata CBS 339.88]
MQTVIDILILGAGWTSTFLTELCDERGITYAATSRSGRESTIKFSFDPDSDDVEPYTVLPKAHTVLITFPIVAKGASERLVRLYTQSHAQDGSKGGLKTGFIQLGTSSIWDGARLAAKTDSGPPRPVEHKWYDRHSPYVPTPRAEAEDELLALSTTFPATVLNLSGLWGGTRQPKNWVGRVAPSKEALKNKGSIHMVHGIDVARAILAIHGDFDKASGQRWLLTDGRVYDWWDLASAWGSPASGPEASKTTDPEQGPQATWVRELMTETGVRALPRDVQCLGRALDSRDFWNTFGISPLRPRLE